MNLLITMYKFYRLSSVYLLSVCYYCCSRVQSGYVLKQFNGFKGYFNLWKSSMWIDDDGENPEIEE